MPSITTPLASGKQFEAKVMEVVPGLGVGKDVVGLWRVFHMHSGCCVDPFGMMSGFRTRQDAKRWAEDLNSCGADWTQDAAVVLALDSNERDAVTYARRLWRSSGIYPYRAGA